MGVKILERMKEDKWLEDDMKEKDKGREKIYKIGINMEDLKIRKSKIWSGWIEWRKRKKKMDGSMGKEILDRMIILYWERRLKD